jgi:3-hydroxymyristoyl/3-hydroxydecanoyl-(acyl carrier protein) dehydratase
VDRVLERDASRRCVTLKIFSADEVLLRGCRIVPASLVVEALCQSAAFLPGERGSGRILRIEEAELKGEVRPGDRLVITTRLVEEGSVGLRAESRGEVEGKVVGRLRVLIAREEAGG